MAKIPFRTAYDEPAKCSFATVGPSLAKQSFKDECDINGIMSKYERTGIVTHRNRFDGSYGDFIGFDDYHKSMNSILEAQEAFASLPATIRKRFSHDASEFLAFAQNPDNLEEMVSLGLAIKRPSDASSKSSATSLPDESLTSSGDASDGAQSA